MYSIDWAIKKKFQIYNVNAEKLESISPTREAFDKFFSKLSGKHSFYIEEGGGDTFKLLALKYFHRIFTTSGRKVKELRERLDLSESDENSAVAIGILAKEHPQEFYKYQEPDINVLKIAILYNEYYRIVKDSSRKKNQLWALKNKLELLISEKEVKKIISKREDTIIVLNKEIIAIRGQLCKLLKENSIWNRCLKDIKGVGPIIAAGIIGSVKRFSRFSNRDALRHFAGMITKKDSSSYNRQLKLSLYNFVEETIKKRTQPWRGVYDAKKLYYKEKHPNWLPGKVNAYAKKAVQTKFLIEVYHRFIKGDCFIEEGIG